MKGRRKIELFVREGVWMAGAYRDGVPDPELIGLFGTHILPCAFTSTAPARDVKQRIEQLNPDKTVEVIA